MSDMNNETKSQLDVIDELHFKLSHLSAMLIMINGDGYDSFNRTDDQTKQDYLLGAYLLASQAHDQLAEIQVHKGE